MSMARDVRAADPAAVEQDLERDRGQRSMLPDAPAAPPGLRPNLTEIEQLRAENQRLRADIENIGDAGAEVSHMQLSDLLADATARADRAEARVRGLEHQLDDMIRQRDEARADRNRLREAALP